MEQEKPFGETHKLSVFGMVCLLTGALVWSGGFLLLLIRGILSFF